MKNYRQVRGIDLEAIRHVLYVDWTYKKASPARELALVLMAQVDGRFDLHEFGTAWMVEHFAGESFGGKPITVRLATEAKQLLRRAGVITLFTRSIEGHSVAKWRVSDEFRCDRRVEARTTSELFEIWTSQRGGYDFFFTCLRIARAGGHRASVKRMVAAADSISSTLPV